MADQGLDAVERRIHRAIAGLAGLVLGAVNLKRHVCLLRSLGAADNAHRHQLDPVVLGVGRGPHQRNQVIFIDFLLAVGQLLEPHEHVLKLVVAQLEPKIFQLGAQRCTARMLAHDDVGLGQAHILGAHDFEGLGVLQHTVLVDAAFVGKGVLADDGLVELHGEPRHSRHTPRDVHQLGAVHAGLERHDVVAHPQGHHDFFQRRVARAFAQAVDRALDLARACFDGGQAVGGRHAQIVVAVGGKNDLVRARHTLQQHADQCRTFTRGCIADRVGDVDGGGPGLDRDFHGAAQVIVFGAGGVHR